MSCTAFAGQIGRNNRTIFDEAPVAGIRGFATRRRDLPEQMVEANGVELCTESFGRPADPPILLIMGIAASMLWWEEGFCRLLAEGGRFVIRYDQRDTGRSV